MSGRISQTTCRRFFYTAAVLIFLALILVLNACGENAGTTQAQAASPAPQTSAPGINENEPTIPSSSLVRTANGYQIKVYFSKFPDSQSNFNAVFPVNRTSPTATVGTFAIQLLIAGPTVEEWNAGYFSELNSILTGPSNCSAPYPTGGPDFKLMLDKKGTAAETGTATIQFCRTTASPGIGVDAHVQAEITATLKQFTSIKKVVILTKDGHCFADESGQDHCLK